MVREPARPACKPEDNSVKIVSKSAALAVICLATFSGVSTSRAGGGEVAAGLLGGFAAGAIVGSAVAPRPYYYDPVYVAPSPYPPPAYVRPACYWTRGEPVWDGYAWVRPRVRVCD
jgi:hypothetical protein